MTAQEDKQIKQWFHKANSLATRATSSIAASPSPCGSFLPLGGGIHRLVECANSTIRAAAQQTKEVNQSSLASARRPCWRCLCQSPETDPAFLCTSSQKQVHAGWNTMMVPGLSIDVAQWRYVDYICPSLETQAKFWFCLYVVAQPSFTPAFSCFSLMLAAPFLILCTWDLIICLQRPGPIHTLNRQIVGKSA